MWPYFCHLWQSDVRRWLKKMIAGTTTDSSTSEMLVSPRDLFSRPELLNNSIGHISEGCLIHVASNMHKFDPRSVYVAMEATCRTPPAHLQTKIQTVTMSSH